MESDILLGKFCRPTLFLVWLHLFKLLSFSCFSSKGYGFWYIGLNWHTFQEYLVKFNFLVKQCNPDGGLLNQPPPHEISSIQYPIGNRVKALGWPLNPSVVCLILTKPWNCRSHSPFTSFLFLKLSHCHSPEVRQCRSYKYSSLFCHNLTL